MQLITRLLFFMIPLHALKGLPPRSHILRVADFSRGIEVEWSSKSFRGETRYQRVSLEDGKWTLKAVARDSASSIGIRLKIDPHQYPIVRWKWKVERLPASGDESSHRGDDSAARLLLAFNESVFPWRIKSICYLWANTLPKGATANNVFSSNVKLVAVESGVKDIGQWKVEERNYVTDYETLFREQAKRLIGIALMTDADNTHSEAIAYYDFIELCSAK